ncbi:hypothetical protein [Pelagicoccus mobilis]|uniref:Lipoprotein n=1 Tax=Pelagicoccus mobilis TaxID=415221 RepID=A0A934RZ87_9BACT|nr:hypothetical protein [Pelagicoccus mobilis]MBK1876213.1 hypothetical protein [Pelagicoccus mobilis]
MKTTHLNLLVAVLSLACSTFLNPDAHSKSFEKILDLDGVKKVTYIEPFLMIVLQNQEAHARVKEQISKIKAEDSDRDLSKIKDSAVLCYYNDSAYSYHKEELSMIKHTNGMVGLLRMQSSSLFTSVYPIDQESGELTENRSTYHRQRGRIGYKLLDEELRSARSFKKRLPQRKTQPDMLISLSYHYTGVIVYPVYDGLIYINGKKLSFQRFQRRLESYPRYENPNKIMSGNKESIPHNHDL